MFMRVIFEFALQEDSDDLVDFALCLLGSSKLWPLVRWVFIWYLQAKNIIALLCSILGTDTMYPCGLLLWMCVFVLYSYGSAAILIVSMGF